MNTCTKCGCDQCHAACPPLGDGLAIQITAGAEPAVFVIERDALHGIQVIRDSISLPITGPPVPKDLTDAFRRAMLLRTDEEIAGILRYPGQPEIIITLRERA